MGRDNGTKYYTGLCQSSVSSSGNPCPHSSPILSCPTLVGIKRYMINEMGCALDR